MWTWLGSKILFGPRKKPENAAESRQSCARFVGHMGLVTAMPFHSSTNLEIQFALPSGYLLLL